LASVSLFLMKKLLTTVDSGYYGSEQWTKNAFPYQELTVHFHERKEDVVLCDLSYGKCQEIFFPFSSRGKKGKKFKQEKTHFFPFFLQVIKSRKDLLLGRGFFLYLNKCTIYFSAFDACEEGKKCLVITTTSYKL